MRGFASLISIVIVLLIGFVLMQTYLRSSIPSGKDGAEQRTAVGTARERAAEVEAIQRMQMEQAEQLAE